jgi:hypothetical protein
MVEITMKTQQEQAIANEGATVILAGAVYGFGSLKNRVLISVDDGIQLTDTGRLARL